MFSSRKRFVKTSLLLALVAMLLALPLTTALAANPPGTGQPGLECEDAGATPGHAASAPGSAFNEDGVAGTVYAGEQPQNSNNVHSVSQYDTACFQVAQH